VPGEEKLIKKIFHAEILTLHLQFCKTSPVLFPKATSGKATGLFMKQFKEKQNIFQFVLRHCQQPGILYRRIIARLINYKL